MINILSICEEIVLSNRLKASLKDITYVHLDSFDNCNDAIDFSKNNKIDIAIVSLSMSLMTGDEVADILVNQYPDLCFIFIYDTTDITLAIELFNVYEGSFIVAKTFLNQDFLNKALTRFGKISSNNDYLSSQNKKYIEKEANYKKVMNEMSSLLNSRLACFKDISVIYSMAIFYLFADSNNDFSERFDDFLSYELSEYITRYLSNPYDSDFANIIDKFVNKYNDIDNGKKYIIENNANVTGNKCIDILFIINLLSRYFSFISDEYRIKINLIESEKLYCLDYISICPIDNETVNKIYIIWEVIIKALRQLCDKAEYASKDGIFQFRAYYKK